MRKLPRHRSSHDINQPSLTVGVNISTEARIWRLWSTYVYMASHIHVLPVLQAQTECAPFSVPSRGQIERNIERSGGAEGQRACLSQYVGLVRPAPGRDGHSDLVIRRRARVRRKQNTDFQLASLPNLVFFSLVLRQLSRNTFVGQLGRARVATDLDCLECTRLKVETCRG